MSEYKDGSLSRRIELPHTILKKASRRMYHTTGLTQEEISGLCDMAWQAAAETGKETWPPSLGLYRSVIVTLSYLRRNRIQAEIAESFGVSQSTISRAISAIAPLLEKTLAGIAPSADDLDPRSQLIVDGTLLPCWSWASAPALYSGKHKTTGMNVQVACTLDGDLAWISDPVEGSRHDMHSGLFTPSGRSAAQQRLRWWCQRCRSGDGNRCA
jgi:transcriptional regulator with XRE-family HTH domain